MKKRIFIAIDISDEARRKISAYIENLRSDFKYLKIGWEKNEKLHLTLKFLGDVETDDIGNLIKAIENVAEKFESFTVKIEENGVFPNVKKARILWLGLTDEKGILKDINDALEKEFEKIGFPKEKRNFKPHLTIARLREPQKSAELDQKTSRK